MLGLQTADVGGALESIRVQAVSRGKGNQKFRDLNMATVELLLPRDSRKVWIPARHESSKQEAPFIQTERPKPLFPVVLFPARDLVVASRQRLAFKPLGRHYDLTVERL